MRIAFCLFLLLGCHQAYADEIKPFTSDGCSAFPDGTIAQNELWLSCCQAHDYAYWQGGTYGQRLQADKELEACVANVGEPEIARLMVLGVRVGGSPFWLTQFRWGYGWPYFDGLWLRGYKPISVSQSLEETNFIDTELTQ